MNVTIDSAALRTPRHHSQLYVKAVEVASRNPLWVQGRGIKLTATQQRRQRWAENEALRALAAGGEQEAGT